MKKILKSNRIPKLILLFFIALPYLVSANELNDKLQILGTSLITLKDKLKTLQVNLVSLKGDLSSALSSIDTTLFEQLALDLKYYKTSNTGFHSGHLYEHSMWTAMVIDRWFEERNGNAVDSGESALSWLDGIDESDRSTLVLAGFLHDVGKASNNNSHYHLTNTNPSLDTSSLHLVQYPTYHAIGTHPEDGFKFLRMIAPYSLSAIKSAAGSYEAGFKNKGQLNFDQMFQKLGLTEEQQQIIQILTGIHWNFGADLMMRNNPKNFLLNLKKYVANVNYNNKTIDERIVRLAIVIGAADVRGAQPEATMNFTQFKKRYVWFQGNTFESPIEHKKFSGVAKFTFFNFAKKGIDQRKTLLDFFTANPQLALCITPVETPYFFQPPFLYASTTFTQYHETLNLCCC